jgi:hypothetical protein
VAQRYNRKAVRVYEQYGESARKLEAAIERLDRERALVAGENPS